jgi:hypothetical protein
MHRDRKSEGAMMRRSVLVAILALGPILLASASAMAGAGGCAEVCSRYAAKDFQGPRSNQ